LSGMVAEDAMGRESRWKMFKSDNDSISPSPKRSLVPQNRTSLVSPLAKNGISRETTDVRRAEKENDGVRPMDDRGKVQKNARRWGEDKGTD
jgi:hypothetical protein